MRGGSRGPRVRARLEGVVGLEVRVRAGPGLRHGLGLELELGNGLGLGAKG
jgi:hypothetical protein